MEISRQRLLDTSEYSGFDPRYLEKSLRLLNILDLISEHRDLKKKFALKGGTALNLYYFNIPRLSVDIDLNYISGETSEAMKARRPAIEKAVGDICRREGFQISDKIEDYSNTTWKLTYQRAFGGRDTIKIDVNYIMRMPLWPIHKKRPQGFEEFNFKAIGLLDFHEIFAGKLRAFFERKAGRDLFDAVKILDGTDYDSSLLRTAFVVYGAAKRKDWREIDYEYINYDLKDIENNLLPLLSSKEKNKITGLKEWADELLKKFRKNIVKILPFKKNEIEFLKEINESGKIKEKLLTKDENLGRRIKKNPALLWKAKNVREHFNI